MKKYKLIVSIVTLLIMLSSTPVFALRNTYTSDGQTFTKPWEITRNDTKYKWTLVYGYNTFLINEDYCHTKHELMSHYAVVENPYPHSASNKAGRWAKIEVRHGKTTPIKYSIVWSY